MSNLLSGYGKRWYVQPGVSMDFSRDPAERRRREEAQLRQQAYGQLAPLLAGRARTATTGGEPGRLTAMLSPGEDPEAAAMLPRTTGVPGSRFDWTSEPTRAEVLAQIAQLRDSPVKSAALEEYLKMRAPEDIQRPQEVTEALGRARESETRERQTAAIAPALRPGASAEQRARAAVEGGREFQEPPSETEVIVQNGIKYTRNRRTGELTKTPEPVRTGEEETERGGLRALIPQYEQQFEAGIKAGTYRAAEVQLGRQLLARAKVTGDPKPFLDFMANVAKERGAEAARKAGMRPERGARTTETMRGIAITDFNRAQYQTSVDSVRNELTQLGVLKDDKLPYVVRRDGRKEPKTQVIEKAYAIANPGQRIQVTWNPGTGQFEAVRVWEVLEKRDMPGTPAEEEEKAE